MRLTKYTHACVLLENHGRRLLLDPGIWTEDAAFEGAHNVLVTHEHFDHLDVERLTARSAANSDLTVYGPAPVAAKLNAVGVPAHAVEVGDTFPVAGYKVKVVGGEHAEIYDGLPGCTNVGYLIDGSIYHPGDSLFQPHIPVEVLLVPTHAPWLKLAETIDFVRAVRPKRAYSIHDAMLSHLGEQSIDRWLEMKAETIYGRIPIGETVLL